MINLFAPLVRQFEVEGSTRAEDVPPKPYARRPKSSKATRVQDVPSARATFAQALTEAMGDGDVLYPFSAEEQWRDLDLDTETLSKLTPSALLDLLKDISPEISSALWTFLRMCNPGWTARAIAAVGEAEDPTAQVALDAMIQRVKEIHGSFDVVINRAYIGGFLRGGFFGEAVLDGRLLADVATPDPITARFKRVKDRVRGSVWELGQVVNGKWIPLVGETIRYIPIDPAPDSPYGRPLAAPAVFTCIFLIGLLHDLRRVVAQQGYPRIDIEVMLDEIVNSMPEDTVKDPEAFRQWVDDTVAEVVEIYQTLAPDDAYVHTSAIKVNKPVGAVDASSLGGVTGLIGMLERQVIRALKTMPLLMGVNEAASETHANRQWEVYAAGVKALQHLAESLLEHLLGVGLRAQGVAARVKFRFAELRASELLRDAQTRNMKQANAWNAYVYGWTSHEEAALDAVGHKADHDGPRYLPNSLTDPTATQLAGELNPSSSGAADDDPPSDTGPDDAAGDSVEEDEPTDVGA